MLGRQCSEAHHDSWLCFLTQPLPHAAVQPALVQRSEPTGLLAAPPELSGAAGARRHASAAQQPSDVSAEDK
jgi:hypothetical protein